MKNRGQRLSGNIVDLPARRIYPGTVEWAGGRITRLTAEPGRRYTQFIAPGFVDAHIHIESSMLPPAGRSCMGRSPPCPTRTRSPTSWAWPAWTT